MKPEAAAFLWDVRRAAQLVEQFCAGMTVERYVEDVLVASAFEPHSLIPYCIRQLA